MLMMYIKSHSLEIPDKKSTLHIEPNDDIYSIVRSAINIIPSALPPAPPTAEPVKELPPRVEEEEVEEEILPFNKGSVAGVMLCDDLQSPWSKEIKMKIHKDGLKDVDDANSAFPSLSAATSGMTTTMKKGPSRIAGSSSVGGWGVDAGKEWKPIMLPPPAAKKPASTPSGSNKGASVAGVPQHAKTTKSEKSSSKTSTNIEELSAIELTKEEFMKAILSKMTGYHAIVQPNGDVNVHSGKVPKVKVIVETRMGNKVRHNNYNRLKLGIILLCSNYNRLLHCCVV